jgi:hypothetical protein
LEKIATQAKDTSFLSRETVQANAGRFWFNITYNLAASGYTGYKKYLSSVLSNYYRITVAEQAKFLVKSILKK